MAQIEIVYKGGLRSTATHEPSKATLSTDSPKEEDGFGENFSPTDLIAAALGSCILGVMGIFAKRHQISLEGAKATVKKLMSENPQRITRLEVVVQMPPGIAQKYRAALERVSHSCPVSKSLAPGIEQPVVFLYPD